MSPVSLLARFAAVLARPGRRTSIHKARARRTELRIADSATLPTRFGTFRIVAFENASDGKEHVALVRGDVRRAESVPVRLHSECLTGDAFGSERCDCRDQLEAAMRELATRENGIILYLRQEGRGIGLANKVRAYALQERGLDTNEANEALGFASDERDYLIAAQMLTLLEVGSIRLMTNNPEKLRSLAFHGVRVEGRIPHIMAARPANARYLETKRAKSGHLL